MSEVELKFSADLQDTGVKYENMKNRMSTYNGTPMSTFEKYTQFVRENIRMKPSVDESSDTTCFGKIQFKETTKRTTARFIRCADDTDPGTLFTLLTDHWNLEKPRLLISVTGGAKSFDLSPRLKKDFQDGLLKVANTPGAWVISGGTNTGVMKLVGDANHGTQNICIGIATWGIVAERDSLKPTKESTSEQRQSGETFPYRLGSYLVQKGEAFLDYNHTHFILVDNGIVGQWGKEIEFRGKFEDHVMQTSNPRIPSVLLVLEGGPGTLDTVLKAVENSIPCVVVEGSGRAADVLVYAINYEDQIREAISKGEPHEGLINEINSAFVAQKERDKVLPLVLKCIQRKDTDIYTIVKVCGGMDTDDAILTALLKDKKTSPSHYEQMRLALLWDRVDLAETKIMSNIGEAWIPRPREGNIAEMRSKEELAAAAQLELNELMIMALAMNKVEFVKLFLSYGVSIKSLLTKNVLQFLYSYRRNMGLSTLRYKASPRQMKNNDVKHRDLFETLQQHRSKKRRLKKTSKGVQEITLEDIREILFELLSSIPDRFLQQVIEIPRDCDQTFNTPFRQLFIWAVMNNMLDLALMLWEFEDDPICKALIAAEITNGLIKSIRPLDLQDEVENSLQLSFSAYQKLSLELLDLCYKTHEKNAEFLITTHIGILSNLSSCLDFAVASKQRDFVAHSCVQGILNDVWTGSIAQRHISGFKICAYIFFPFLLSLGTKNWEIEIRTQNEMKEMIQTGHFDDSDEEAEELVVNHCKQHAGNIVFDAKTRVRSVYLANNENTGQADTMEKEEDQSQLRTRLSFWRKFYNFHVFSPIVRFYVHTFGYLLFLVLFSYIATVKKTSNVPTDLEILLIITVIGYAANEIYQLFHIDAPSFGLKVKGYVRDFWNQFDIVCLLVFLIAIILRCIPSTVEYGHLFYAFDVSLWIVRLINILFVDPTAGPYVVMIGHMFLDLVNFLVILVIFLLAYGIAVKGILDPTEADGQMFVASVFKPYFHWHGEYFIDAPEDGNKTYFGTEKRNSYAEPIALIYMALYLLIVNILLLNLVIAIFNSTYEKIMAIALRVWKFERYGLIVEYAQRRSFLFPPLSLIYHFYILIQWCLSKCTHLEPKSCYSGLKPRGNPNCSGWQVKMEKFRELENNCLIRIVRERANNDVGLDVPVESSGSLQKSDFEKRCNEEQRKQENLETRIMDKLENMTDKDGQKSVKNTLTMLSDWVQKENQKSKIEKNELQEQCEQELSKLKAKFEKERRELQVELEEREKELDELKKLARKEKNAMQDELNKREKDVDVLNEQVKTLHSSNESYLLLLTDNKIELDEKKRRINEVEKETSAPSTASDE